MVSWDILDRRIVGSGGYWSAPSRVIGRPGLDCPVRGGGSSVGRAPGCGPGGRGFESPPPPLVAGPCSSADRAAAFEAACGGSTPPRAITAAAPDGRACVPCLKSRFRVKGGVSEGVAHSTSLSRETPVFDLWGNHQTPVVQHHPFSPLPQRTRPNPGLRLAGGSHAFDSAAAAAGSAAAAYPVIRAGVAKLATAPGLGPGGAQAPWGFKSLRPH